MVGCCSSVVERILGKAEVGSSILPSSTIQSWFSGYSGDQLGWALQAARFRGIPVIACLDRGPRPRHRGGVRRNSRRKSQKAFLASRDGEWRGRRRRSAEPAPLVPADRHAADAPERWLVSSIGCRLSRMAMTIASARNDVSSNASGSGNASGGKRAPLRRCGGRALSILSAQRLLHCFDDVLTELPIQSFSPKRTLSLAPNMRGWPM